MNPAIEVHYYQLENLILQKIPFKFFNFTGEENLVSQFVHLNPYYVRFLREQLVNISSIEMGLSYLNANSLPLDNPIVVICADGKLSASFCSELERKDFKNIYIVPSGLNQLKLEIQSFNFSK